MTNLEAKDIYLGCLWLRTLSCVYLSVFSPTLSPCSAPRPANVSPNLTSFPAWVLSRLPPPPPPPAPGCHYLVFGTFLSCGDSTHKAPGGSGKGGFGHKSRSSCRGLPPLPDLVSGISGCARFLLILSLSLPLNRRWAQSPQLLPPKRPPRL